MQINFSISWVVTNHFDEVGDDDTNTATSFRHVFYCCAVAWLSGWLRLLYDLAEVATWTHVLML